MNPGDEPCGEHGGHRQVPEDRIDDHRLDGRDQDADGASGRSRRRSVILGIAVADHRRDEDGAHGGDGPRPGAGNGREERAGEDGGDAEAAVDAAHKLLHHVDDLLRDVPELHERARDHKTGDGEQREQVQAVKKRVVDDRQGRMFPPARIATTEEMIRDMKIGSPSRNMATRTMRAMARGVIRLPPRNEPVLRGCRSASARRIPQRCASSPARS